MLSTVLPTNQSSLDRSIRLFLGASLAFATAPGVPLFDGIGLKYVLFVFALLNVGAALTGWCAGYALFGFSTCKTKISSDTLTLDQAERFTTEDIRSDFKRLQRMIIGGVATLLTATAVAFLYSEINTAQSSTLEQKRIQLLVNVQALQSALMPELVTDAGVDSLSEYRLQRVLQDHLTSGAAVLRLEHDDLTTLALQGMEQFSERGVLQAFDTAFNDASIDDNRWEPKVFDWQGTTMVGVNALLDDRGSSLTLIQPANLDSEQLITALKRAGIIGAIYVWVVAWMTFLLMRAVGERHRQSTKVIELAFARIANHNQDLEKIVRERTRDAEEAREEAVAASQAKSAFLANMSHEIRTPLNAIIGMTQLALNTELPKKLRKQLRTANTSAGMLLGIINDILDFSKIEAGKLEVEHAVFNLEEICTSVLDILRLKADERGLELMFDMDPTLPKAMIGDRLRLSQILANLGSNAVKFTDTGGEVVVRLYADMCSEHVVKLHGEVRDTGIGISAEQQKSLFQTFSQADISTTRQFGGTGLGLAISKSLTDLMNGDIWVESALGEGSTFHFVVELGVADAAPAIARSVPVYKRALVVDDSRNARAILEHQLSAFEGLKVDLVSKGTEAIKALRQADSTEPYDLIIVDWRMPDLDGVETIQLIQSDSKISRPPDAILVSAYASTEIQDVDDDIALLGFLNKPVLPTELARLLCGGGASNEVEAKRVSNHDSDDESPEARLRGAHLLLAEDNELNRELMEEILEDLGIQVTMVHNGWEAIEALENGEFDGVLMDGQMPVMDGYTATEAIRKQAKFKDLPIIALTANAMDHDRLRSLESGMNDHISKPIDLDTMVETMARWIQPKQRTASTPRVADAAGMSAKEMRARLSSLASVDADMGLVNASGQIDVYWQRLVKFADQYAGFDKQFWEVLETGGLEDARRLAHSLKGLAANMALTEVATAARVLELTCKTAVSYDSLELPLNDVVTALEQAIDDIDRL